MSLKFYRKLKTEAAKLEKMSSKATWRKILENEEDRTAIKESFERIDEYREDFQVGQPCL